MLLDSFAIRDLPLTRQFCQIYKDAEFQNWGVTVENKPRYTCVPKTTHGVQEIVKYAKAMNMAVRVSGYREYISIYPSCLTVQSCLKDLAFQLTRAKPKLYERRPFLVSYIW